MSVMKLIHFFRAFIKEHNLITYFSPIFRASPNLNGLQKQNKQIFESQHLRFQFFQRLESVIKAGPWFSVSSSNN